MADNVKNRVDLSISRSFCKSSVNKVSLNERSSFAKYENIKADNQTNLNMSQLISANRH